MKRQDYMNKINPINLELSDNLKKFLEDQKYYQDLYWKTINERMIKIPQ